jgi:hypothetical protein
MIRWLFWRGLMCVWAYLRCVYHLSVLLV